MDLGPGEIQALSYSFYIEAAATPMTAAEYVTYQTNLADKIRTAILADSSAPAMLQLAAANQTDWEDGYLQALEDTGQLRPADMPPAALAVPAISSLMSTIGAGILGGPAGQSIITTGNLDSFFSQVLSWYGNTPARTAARDRQARVRLIFNFRIRLISRPSRSRSVSHRAIRPPPRRIRTSPIFSASPGWRAKPSQ